MRVFSFLFAILCLLACSDKDAEKLRESVKSEIMLDERDSLSTKNMTLSQYKEMELKCNKQYVEDLKKLIDGGFEKQLEKFEDEELGVISGYGYMFAYFFKNGQSWEDDMLLKSDKYFNTIDVEQEANKLFIDYVRNIKQLRCRFWKLYTPDKLPSAERLNLPQTSVSLLSLSTHSRNNIFIELLTEGLERLIHFLLYPLFIWLFGALFNCIPIIGTNHIGCAANAVLFIICIIASSFISMYNDNLLLDELRKEQVEITTVEYGRVLDNLNINSQKFYEVK